MRKLILLLAFCVVGHFAFGQSITFCYSNGAYCPCVSITAAYSPSCSCVAVFDPVCSGECVTIDTHGCGDPDCNLTSINVLGCGQILNIPYPIPCDWYQAWEGSTETYWHIVCHNDGSYTLGLDVIPGIH